MTYLSGTTTELVRRNDILHMAFSRFDLFDRGWTEQQIKYDLGTPDFRVRVGKRNTGPVLYWKKARVREIEARIGITYQKFEDWYEEWKRTTATRLEAIPRLYSAPGLNQPCVKPGPGVKPDTLTV